MPVLAQTTDTTYQDSILKNYVAYDSLNIIPSNKSIDQIKNLKKPDSTNSKKIFGFHGTIMTEAQYADKQYAYQQVPQSYVRWTISPELTLFGMPFKSAINLTTEQGKVNYNLNRFNLALDVNALRTALTKQLKAKAAETQQTDIFNQKKWEDSLNKSQSIDKQIDDLKELLKTDSLELEKLKGNLPKNTKTGLPDSLAATDLKYRVNYKDYSEKNEKYKATLKTIDSLLAIKEEYVKYKRQYDKFKQAGAFDTETIQKYNGIGFPDKYKNHPTLGKAEQFLLSVRNFSFGAINPNTSSPYMQGATINGISIENGFGKFYTQLSAGLLYQQLSFGSLNQKPAQKYLYSAKAGYGMPENTHLHFGVIKTGTIGKNKQEQWDDTSINAHQPGVIYNVDGRVNIRENINVTGYWALSETNKTTTFNPTENTAPNQRYNIVELPNTSWSINANGNFNEGKTKITAQLLRIGTGFYSIANPFLRNDLLRQEIKVTQKLYKNFISINGSYRKDRDNLLNQKQYTTSTDNYKASLNIRLKKMPSFILSYNNIYQSSNTAEQKNFMFYTRTKIFTVTSVYNKRIKDKTLSTSLTYMYQEIASSVVLQKRQYNNIVYTAGLFNQKGNGINYTSTISIGSGPNRNNVFNNQIEGVYTYPKRLVFITSGGFYQTIDNLLGNSGGVFIKQTASFWKKSSIALCFKENFFRHIYDNSISYQTIVNVQIIQQW